MLRMAAGGVFRIVFPIGFMATWSWAGRLVPNTWRTESRFSKMENLPLITESMETESNRDLNAISRNKKGGDDFCYFQS
jgi:hypothetical protein